MMHGSIHLPELDKKAISDRDWGSLNYNLLNDKDIQVTMTDSAQYDKIPIRSINNQWLDR